MATTTKRTYKRNEDHPKLKHAQKVTHRASDGKFKGMPGNETPPHFPTAPGESKAQLGPDSITRKKK